MLKIGKKKRVADAVPEPHVVQPEAPFGRLGCSLSPQPSYEMYEGRHSPPSTRI